MSKAHFHLYDELPKAEKAARTAAAEASERYGEAAVARNPASIEARYWYTQGMLGVADMKGAASFLKRIRKVRQLIGAVREEDPTIDDGGPDRFQAIVLLEAPWPIGDAEEARGYAEAAFEIAPDRCANVFVLAASRVRTGQVEQARPLYDRLRTSQCRASSPYWLELYRTEYVEKLRDHFEE